MFEKLTTLGDVDKLYGWFEQMRRDQPVWRDESSGCWHLFRYEDVHSAITDYKLFSSAQRRVFNRPSVTVDGHEVQMGRSLIIMDPPEHKQYRNLVSSTFTPRALERMKDRIKNITQELLNEVRPTGHIDVIADIAYPLPTIVIAEMLGVPISDRPLFKRWADGLLSRQLSDAELVKPAEEQRNNPEIQQANRTLEEMSDYFKRILKERQQAPRDDMMSALLAAEVDGEHLSMEDTIGFCTLLLLAGHVTTTNLLSQALRCFDEFPETQTRLREQPELMPAAIEEILRYASPVWRLLRTTTAPVTVAGVTIPKEALVFPWLASANRDEQQFPDPDRFDITRTPNRHIAFGHGIHFCIGAPLSRMEASIALPMILAQLPNLHLDRSQPLTLLEGRVLFGFKRLPMTFTPSRLSRTA